MYSSTEFFVPGSNSEASSQVKDQVHSNISYLNKVTGLSKKFYFKFERHSTKLEVQLQLHTNNYNVHAETI